MQSGPDKMHFVFASSPFSISRIVIFQNVALTLSGVVGLLARRCPFALSFDIKKANERQQKVEAINWFIIESSERANGESEKHENFSRFRLLGLLCSHLLCCVASWILDASMLRLPAPGRVGPIGLAINSPTHRASRINFIPTRLASFCAARRVGSGRVLAGVGRRGEGDETRMPSSHTIERNNRRDARQRVQRGTQRLDRVRIPCAAEPSRLRSRNALGEGLFDIKRASR
jgi:hypothetical protein